MTDRHEFLYVQSDVPEGQTLREWRRGHSAPHMGLWARFRAWRTGR